MGRDAVTVVVGGFDLLLKRRLNAVPVDVHSVVDIDIGIGYGLVGLRFETLVVILIGPLHVHHRRGQETVGTDGRETVRDIGLDVQSLNRRIVDAEIGTHGARLSAGSIRARGRADWGTSSGWSLRAC